MLVQCEVTEGPREGFKAVSVASVEGHVENFAIEERFLVRDDDDQFRLPVKVVGRDRNRKITLIQLPVEADSGANRAWVRDDVLSPSEDEVPA